MKPEISILIPAIRNYMWTDLYNSILQSTTRSFEVVFIGPYPLPPELENLRNVKYIKDFGSPTRCFNMGLLFCEGELLTYVADDATFNPGMLDKAIDDFRSMPPNSKNVLILKYSEGSRETQPDDYYRLANAYPKVNAILGKDLWIFNFTLLRTAYMKQLGGLDARFGVTALAHADLSVRAAKDGCNAQIVPYAVVHNTHGHGDHTPVERSHVDHDEPLYKQIHNDPANDNRICLDINNWKQASHIWTRRFG